MAAKKTFIPAERIERAILLIRGHKVLLDSDLALLYGVTIKRLNERIVRETAVHTTAAVFFSRKRGQATFPILNDNK